MNLVIGGSSRFGKELEKCWPAKYLSSKELNLHNYSLTDWDSVDYDNVVILSKSGSNSIVEVAKFVEGIFQLLNNIHYNKAWIFTSGMGTFQNSKNNQHMTYSAEKMLLNFISYKKNFKDHKIILIQPGQMITVEEYQHRVQDFLKLLDNPPSKNLIWDLSKNCYMLY